jgi:PAS domain S-box-containing protein
MKNYPTPARLLVVTMASVFVIEAMVMFSLSFIDNLPPYLEIAVDSVLLSFLVFPALFFYLYRPMVLHIKLREDTEKLLKETNENLGVCVEERTAELICTNKLLEKENHERRQSDEKLNEQLIFLQTLIDAIPSPVFYKSEKAVYVGCNKAFEQFIGRVKEDIVGKTVYDIAPHKLADGYHEKDVELFNRPGTQVYESCVVDKARKIRNVVFNKATFLKNDGEVGGLVGVVLDITERTEYEEKLRKYKHIVNASQDHMAFVDSDYIYRKVNNAYLRAHDKELHEVVGHQVQEVFGEDIFNNVLKSPLERALTGELVHYQYWFDYPAKGRRYMDVVYSPFVEEDNSITGIIVNSRDITHRKELQDNIEQAKVEWEETFDIINDAITIHDNNFNIIRANKAAKILLNKSFEEILQSKCHDSYHGTICPPARCPSCESLKTGKPSLSEVFEPHLDKYLKVKALPRFDKNNQITGLVHIVSDITEQKKAEEETEELREKFYQAQKIESVGRLAGGVAHDFNNLLTGINGFLGFALDQVEEKSSLYDDLHETQLLARRAGDLTRQLLAFSRHQKLDPVPLDINMLVGNLTKMLKRLIGEDIHLSYTSVPDLQPVWADPGQIEQVIVNLSVNARDAMPKGGQLSIEVDATFFDEEIYAGGEFEIESRSYIRISVSDTGTGIDKTMQDKIFEPFFTTKAVGAGTGLGLSTVYGIVKQHKGVVEVDSGPGKGSSFKIYLPVFEGEVTEKKREKNKNISQKGSETILFVEDEETVRNVTRRLLTEQGYKVFSAAGSDEAKEIFAERGKEIDLLLTDVVMPKLNGRELFELLSAERPDLKVIYMSGYAMDILDAKGISADNLQFIQKPFSRDKFVEKIRQVLAGEVIS